MSNSVGVTCGAGGWGKKFMGEGTGHATPDAARQTCKPAAAFVVSTFADKGYDALEGFTEPTAEIFPLSDGRAYPACCSGGTAYDVCEGFTAEPIEDAFPFSDGRAYPGGRGGGGGGGTVEDPDEDGKAWQGSAVVTRKLGFSFAKSSRSCGTGRADAMFGTPDKCLSCAEGGGCGFEGDT